MNQHLSYFLTAIGETLILYLVLSYIEITSDVIHKEDVYVILITNFIAAYSGFYLLPWISNF
tara:strand:+ start:1059 stop:1244 length:186 start_codon:yes stop_codon:yes gene_type:complete